MDVRWQAWQGFQAAVAAEPTLASGTAFMFDYVSVAAGALAYTFEDLYLQVWCCVHVLLGC